MRQARSFIVSAALLFSLTGCPGEDVVDATDSSSDVSDTVAPDVGDTATPPDDTVEPDTALGDTFEADTLEVDTAVVDTFEADTLEADTFDGDTSEVDTAVADTVAADTVVPPQAGETCADPLVVDALPYVLAVDTSAFTDDLSTQGACGLGGDRGAGSGDLVVAFTAPTTGLYRWTKPDPGGPALITAAAACDGPALSGCDAASGDLWAGGAWTLWRAAGETVFYVVDGWFPGDHGPTTLTLDAVDATACPTYCGLVTTGCTGPDAQYTSYAHCLDYCQSWAALTPGDPAAGPTGANTVACRAHEAALAPADPATHCPAAGPTGAGTCGTPCDAYCDLYANNCDGLAPAFASTAACLSACATLDATGPATVTTGDTLQCRLYHLAIAGADSDSAAAHCADGAIAGGTSCGAIPPPSGATCAAPIPIASVPYLHLGATLDAGANVAFSDGACPGSPGGRGAAGQDRVYAFTPTLPGRYRVALADADFDAALYAATTCDDVDATCLAANDVAGPGGDHLTLDLPADAPVYLFVDGWSDSEDVSGHYRLTVERLDPTECATYCASVTTACAGADAQYPSYAACLAICADIPPGVEGADPADTVACRAAEADLAAADPARCPAAGPTGAGTCGTLCDTYCRLAATTCAIYDTDAACVSACAAFPATGALGDVAGDSVQCRLSHVIAADTDPSSCLAATPSSATCAETPPATGDSCADPFPVTTFPFVYSGQPSGGADLGGCDGTALGPDLVFAVTATVAGVYPLTLEGGPFDRLYTLDAACAASSCAETDRLVLAAGETAHVVLDATSPIIAASEFTLTVGAPAPTSCGDYCTLYTAACAPLSPYPSEDDCVDGCLAAARPAGTATDSAVDTTACRAHHAGLALSGDPTACVAAGPDGGGVCGSFCDTYCHLAMAQCLGDDRIFPTPEACASVCPYLPLVGRPGDLVGDSLFCRTTYLAAAQVSLPGQTSTVDRCLAGGVTGGAVCAGPVPGDTCADPVVVDAVPFYLPGDTSWWSDDSSTAGTCGDPADRGAGTGDLVIRFRPTATGDYRWTKLGPGGPGMLQLATDCADLGASCVGLSGDLWPGGAWTVSLTADTDYYFILDGWLPADEGPFSLLLEATP